MLFNRSRRKRNNATSELLDEPMFECVECNIIFAVKYIPEYEVMYCHCCDALLVSPHTTLRKKYLTKEE